MNRAVFFIFITLLLDITGLGIILPVLPDLIQDLTDANISDASVIGGWLLFAFALPQFIFAPIMGGLSDRYGRRPVLLFSLSGYGLDHLIMGFAPTLGWLFLGRILAGVLGASITTAMAFIADVSTKEQRAANFGMVGAAFGLGFILGPMIGGVLGEFGPRVPFFVAAGLTFANVVFGYFVLPESLPPEKRRTLNIKRANPFGALKQISMNKIVLCLASAFFLSELGHHAYQSTWTFYTIESFGFSSSLVGLSLGVFGLLYALVNGWLIRIILPKVGEVNGIWLGLGFSLFGFFGFAFIASQWQMWLMLIPAALGGFLTPSLQGVMANSTDDNAQGELQGALTSLKSLASILGPLAMTAIFWRFTSHDPASWSYLPGAPFLAGGLLMVIAVLPILLGLRRRTMV